MGEQEGAVHDDDDEDGVVGGECHGAHACRATPLQDDPGAEQEGGGYVGEGGAVGEVVGDCLASDEVAPDKAGKADGYDAKSEDVASETCGDAERL